jgi:hypothetical protein
VLVGKCEALGSIPDSAGKQQQKPKTQITREQCLCCIMDMGNEEGEGKRKGEGRRGRRRQKISRETCNEHRTSQGVRQS